MAVIFSGSDPLQLLAQLPTTQESYSDMQGKSALVEFSFARYLGKEDACFFSSASEARRVLFEWIAEKRFTEVWGTTSRSDFFSFNPLPSITQDKVRSLRSKDSAVILISAVDQRTGLLSDLEPVYRFSTAAPLTLIIDETFAFGSVGLRGCGGVEVLSERLNLPAYLAFSLVLVDLSYLSPLQGVVVAGPALEVARLKARRYPDFLPPSQSRFDQTEKLFSLLETAVNERTLLETLRLRAVELFAPEVAATSASCSNYLVIAKDALDPAAKARALGQKGYLLPLHPQGGLVLGISTRNKVSELEALAKTLSAL